MLDRGIHASECTVYLTMFAFLGGNPYSAQRLPSRSRPGMRQAAIICYKLVMKEKAMILDFRMMAGTTGLEPATSAVTVN